MNKYKVQPSGLDNVSVRFRSTAKRVKIEPPALDAGGENDFAKALGINDFVPHDLNEDWHTAWTMETITSFEVIEHLQNPLLYLWCIYDSLEPGGKLYLTTPVRWIFKGKYHFHEFSREELETLLKMAGFKTWKIERIQAYDLKHFGIRPLIRKIRDLLFGQCFFVKATK